MFEFLHYTFLQRAFIGGLILAFIFALLGIFIIMRKMSFLGEGIAHASLTGIAIGIIVSYNPLITAIIYSVGFVIVLYFLEKKSSISPDALIGTLFTSSLSLGLMLMSFQRGYQPDLMSFLFGNILSIQSSELWIMAVLGLVILFIFMLYRRKIIFTFIDRDAAFLQRINTSRIELLFYCIVAVAVVLGVKMLGIILVSALLIIPTTTAKLFSRSLSQIIISSVLLSEGAVLGGIFISYRLNLPTGPSIVLLSSIIFFVVFIICQILPSRNN